MIDKNMIALAEIRNGYALNKYGNLTLEQNSLIKYDNLCLNLIKENQELKKENKILRENAEHNDKVVDKVNWEDQLLKKQLEERPKEYVFIGNAQNKTRDFINQITKDNKEYKNKQKYFIEYLENMLDNENDIFSVVRVKDVLSKYKEIIGVSK